MAKKTDKIIEVFTSTYGKPVELLSEVQRTELADVNQLIRELATNLTPNNKYEIAQIVGYTLDSLLKEKLNYLEQIADIKFTDYQERPKFKIKKDGVKVYWQSIGSTVDRSKTGADYVDLKLESISARPYVEWADLASGRYDFSELITEALLKFEQAIAKKVQDTLFTAFSALPSPNYATGSGVVATSFDPLLFAMRRFGSVSIVGDIEALAGLTALTGFSSKVPESLMVEHNMNGYIGTYKGANVIALNNPIENRTGFGTVLDRGYIYIVPSITPELKPVKIQFAGDIRSLDATNIDDGSYEIRLDKLAGVAVIGDRKAMAVYNDSSL